MMQEDLGAGIRAGVVLRLSFDLAMSITGVLPAQKGSFADKMTVRSKNQTADFRDPCNLIVDPHTFTSALAGRP